MTPYEYAVIGAGVCSATALILAIVANQRTSFVRSCAIKDGDSAQRRIRENEAGLITLTNEVAENKVLAREQFASVAGNTDERIGKIEALVTELQQPDKGAREEAMAAMRRDIDSVIAANVSASVAAAQRVPRNKVVPKKG